MDTRIQEHQRIGRCRRLGRLLRVAGDLIRHRARERQDLGEDVDLSPQGPDLDVTVVDVGAAAELMASALDRAAGRGEMAGEVVAELVHHAGPVAKPPQVFAGGLQMEVPPLLLVGVEGVGRGVVQDP